MYDLHVTEELLNIYDNQPVWPGDTLSHDTANECVDYRLVARNYDGNFITTEEGNRHVENLLLFYNNKEYLGYNKYIHEGLNKSILHWWNIIGGSNTEDDLPIGSNCPLCPIIHNKFNIQHTHYNWINQQRNLDGAVIKCLGCPVFESGYGCNLPDSIWDNAFYELCSRVKEGEKIKIVFTGKPSIYTHKMLNILIETRSLYLQGKIKWIKINNKGIKYSESNILSSKPLSGPLSQMRDSFMKRNVNVTETQEEVKTVND